MSCPLCRSTELLLGPDALKCADCGALFARRAEKPAPVVTLMVTGCDRAGRRIRETLRARAGETVISRARFATLA